MFIHRSDPGADGVGVAFTSAEVDLGDRQDAASRGAAFAAVSGALGVPLAVVSQVHGADVCVVDADAPVTGGIVDLTGVRADVLVTARRGVGLAVRVADCVPVLLADAVGAVVAAAHAGREGLLVGVLGSAVAAVRARSAAPLRAWVGPHICGACYEVPDAMAADAAVRLGVDIPATRWGTRGIDLGAAARRQLERLGVAVTEVGECTFTAERLHSHRRDPAAGRLAGIVWLAEQRA